MSGLESWQERARCREVDGAADTFTAAIDAGDYARVQEEAKQICVHCPVWEVCLLTALVRGERGVWGGTTERERRRAVRRNPSLPRNARRRLLGGGGRRIVVRDSAAGAEGSRRESGQQRAG